MSLASRREYVAQMRARYAAARDRKTRSALLDELVAVTGFHRKHAIRVLRGPAPPGPRSRRHRARRYAGCLPVVALAWEALDYCCAERLHPRLLAVAEQLERHGVVRLTPAIRAELQQISRATLARRLRDLPSPKPRRLVTRPRPGAVLTTIPIGRYAWNETRPGALEVDCLEHNGGTTAGHYAVTVSLTDIVTGWSARHAVLGRSQRAIHAALATLLAAWPHPPWGLHPDNGGEFLNDHIRRFCQAQGLELTRSRPYRKNDNAHVEQRNRFLRDVVGYARYDTPAAVAWLNAVYARLDPYANLVLPSMKCVAKTRDGARIRKTYDTPRPPAVRLLEAGVLAGPARAALERALASLNPLQLHRDLEHWIAQGPSVEPGPFELVAGGR